MTLTATHATPLDASAIKAALDRLDHTAHELERKWGVGRLRMLVDDLLRARFDRQAKLLDEALWGEPGSRHGTEVVAQIDAMERGWRKLDQVAGANHAPKPPEFWECMSPGGKLFIVVPTNADASLIADYARGRQATVYLAEEVGRLLEAWPLVATAKAAFQGATVTEIRPRRPVDWGEGDDLPF
jgi:hypothetical protein